MLLCYIVLCSMISVQALFGQTNAGLTGEIQSSLKKPGVPEGLSVTESYRSISHSFYSLPEGIKFTDLNDMEKVSLQAFQTDERFIITEDALGSRVVVKEVLKPEKQFVPQALPYSIMIMQGGYVSFLDARGQLIHESYVGEEAEEELPDVWEGEPEGLLKSGGKDFPENGGEGDFIFREEGYEVIVNQSRGMIATTISGPEGDWATKHLEFYDLNDEERGIPLYEISVERTTTSYGNCVFYVVMTSYPEYIRMTGKGEEEPVNPRSAGETEIYAQLEAARIWPNPATSNAFIELPNIPDVREVNVTIIGLDGREVYQQVYPTNSTHSIQLSGVAPGIYIARLQAEGVTRIEKLIIQ